MPVIGQAFSPGFLQLALQQQEGAKDRNLKAAIADRQTLLGTKELAQKAEIANAAGVQGGQSVKAQIEAMKEQGRNQRASEANQLKAALEAERMGLNQQGLEIKQGAEQRRTKEGEAKVLFLNAKTNELEALTPHEVQNRQLKNVGQQFANETAELRVENERLQIAELQNKIRYENATFGDRVANVGLLNEKLRKVVDWGDQAAAIADRTNKVELAMKVQNAQERRAAMFKALADFATQVNQFGQTPQDVATEQGPDSRAQIAMTMLNTYLEVFKQDNPAAYQAFMEQQGWYGGGPPRTTGDPSMDAATAAPAPAFAGAMAAASGQR